MHSYSTHYYFYSFLCFNALTAASLDATGNEHIEKNITNNPPHCKAPTPGPPTWVK
jgi:hypothetical protein